MPSLFIKIKSEYKLNAGFTLIELMIVVAIIGILASVALPAYQTYANRSKFVEVTLETASPKNAILIAIQTKLTSTGANLALSDLQPGSYGIPLNTLPTNTRHGVSVLNGVISVTWKSDGSDLAGITYVLKPHSATSPVIWSQEGTCVTKSYC